MVGDLFELIRLKITTRGIIDDKYSKKNLSEQTKTSASINRIIAEVNSSSMNEEDKDKVKADAIIEYCRNQQKKSSIKQKTYEKMHQQVFKAAAKAVAAYCDADVDSELYNKILKLISISDRYSYYNKAKESQQLINYTIWKCTDSDAIGLSTLTKDQKMFINGICQELHADFIYTDIGAADIKLYDPWISGWNDQRYLVNLEAIKNLVSVNLMDKIARVKNPYSTGASNGLKSPIKFTFSAPNKNNTLVDPDKEVDSYNLSLLNNAIEEFFTEERQYRWELGSTPNNFKLIAMNPLNGIWEEFYFCIGFFGKDTIAMLVPNMFGSIVPIHSKCKELWQKALGNCFYRLTDAETNIAAAAVSTYYYLYNSIDMSVVPEDEIVGLLDMKLNFVFNDFQFNGIVLSSYKFEKYNGLNDFIMLGKDGSTIISNDIETCYRLGSTYRTVKNN